MNPCSANAFLQSEWITPKFLFQYRSHCGIQILPCCNSLLQGCLDQSTTPHFLSQNFIRVCYALRISANTELFFALIIDRKAYPNRFIWYIHCQQQIFLFLVSKFVCYAEKGGDKFLPYCLFNGLVSPIWLDADLAIAFDTDNKKFVEMKWGMISCVYLCFFYVQDALDTFQNLLGKVIHYCIINLNIISRLNVYHWIEFFAWNENNTISLSILILICLWYDWLCLRAWIIEPGKFSCFPNCL